MVISNYTSHQDLYANYYLDGVEARVPKTTTTIDISSKSLLSFMLYSAQSVKTAFKVTLS